MITDTQYQTSAENLIIGWQIIPQILVHAADGRPFELQDLLIADARFKVLVFAGNTSSDVQLDTLHKLAAELEQILTK
jgi:phenol 2-monooxygenase (NADPH)